jgi:Uma2 family endonuclease
VRNQAPFNPGGDSAPMPDLVVVPGGPRDYPEDPTTALLVVEISETTLAIDRKRKASLYASAGIGEYWIVNLVQRQVEVHRGPVADASQPSGHAYADVQIVRSTEHLSPLAVANVKIPVADLLP